MRLLLALIIALAIGVTLVAIGVWIFAYGLGEPIICRNYAGRGACGNFPLIIGVFITLAGLTTLSGAIIYAVRVREGSDEEPSDE